MKTKLLLVAFLTIVLNNLAQTINIPNHTVIKKLIVR